MGKEERQMRFKRLGALLLTAGLCLGMLGGCGTSHMESESELDTASVDSSWQQLSPSATPERGTVTPALEQQRKTEDGSKDVTKEYKSSLVGVWDNADGTKVYTFKSNENLEIAASGATTSYTYWLEDNGKQVWLYVFQNGAEDATTYSFTLSGNNLTLYDTETGNAVEQLVRRVEEVSPSPTSTPAPAATATPAPQTPTPTAAPTPTPTPSSTPEVSESPEPSPSQTPDPTLPDEIRQALPEIECALDSVMDGTSFDAQDPTSFWSIVVRYLSRTNESEDDGTFVVTESQALGAAQQIFSGVMELAQLPEDSGLAELIPGEDGAENQYRMMWGAAGGHDLEVTTYDDSGNLTVLVDGQSTYSVTIDDGGAIVSITAQ